MKRPGDDDSRGRITAILAGFAALCIWIPMALPLLSGRVFHNDDLGLFHLPLRLFYAECLASGDDFRWHPGLYCGFYVHGEGQAGMAHPAHRLMYQTLSPAAAFQAEIVAGYPLMLLGMVFWLRRVGLRLDASIYGGMVFAFSQFTLLRYVHTNAVQVIAHLPWLLLLIEILGRPRSDREASFAMTGVGLLTASQCLLGYPQYVGLSMLVEASYSVARLGRSRIAWSRFLGAIFLGLLAGGRQLVSHWDALRNSFRQAPSEGFLGTDSLHPWNLLQIVAPELFKLGYYHEAGPAGWPRHERVAYLGAVVPASLAWLWIRRRSLATWKPFLIWGVLLGSGSLILALGRFSPCFSIYAKLPLASLFRAPNRFLLITQIAAAALSALAFCDAAVMIYRREKLTWDALIPLATPSLISLLSVCTTKAITLTSPGWFFNEQVDATRGLVASVAWISIPCLAFALVARGRKWGLPLLVLVATLDPVIHSLRPLLARDRPLLIEEFAGPMPPEPGRSRILAPPHSPMAYGSRLVEGYVALTPARELDYHNAKTLRLAGAGWERVSDGNGGWIALPPSLERARLVSRTISSRNPRADLETIDPSRVALVAEGRTYPEGPVGTATLSVDRPGLIQVVTRADFPRFLVVSESFHEGWKLDIDGEAAVPVRAYGDFLGSEIGPGEHRVTFRFDPASDRVGSLLGAAGLCGLLGIQILAYRRSRPDVVTDDMNIAPNLSRRLTSTLPFLHIWFPFVAHPGRPEFHVKPGEDRFS